MGGKWTVANPWNQRNCDDVMTIMRYCLNVDAQWSGWDNNYKNNFKIKCSTKRENEVDCRWDWKFKRSENIYAIAVAIATFCQSDKKKNTQKRILLLQKHLFQGIAR